MRRYLMLNLYFLDIFDEYTRENFEKEFKKSFVIHEIYELKDSKRIMYFMEKGESL